MSDATIETEFGVPIPGEILPQERWAKTALKRLPETGPLDTVAIFGREAPLVLDLGCGNGRSTLAGALAHPEFDYVGVDLLPVVIRYATRRANQRGLSNVRFAVKDAQTFLRISMKSAAAREIWIYHPQPYRDPRDARLRLLTPEFLADVHRVLEPGGVLLTQTDNPEYWRYMRGVLDAFFEVDESTDPWPDAPEGRTRREILARQRGLTVYRAHCRRRDDLAVDEAHRIAAGLPRPNFRIRGPWNDLDRVEREPE